MNYGYYPNYNNGAMPDMLGQYRQMQQPMMPPMQQQPNSMIWVQGEAGAKSYLVAPGNTVVLWDSEDPIIYIKTADASGLPGMKVLEYSERTAAPRGQQAMGNQYATVDMVNELRGKIDGLAARMEGITKEENNNG